MPALLGRTCGVGSAENRRWGWLREGELRGRRGRGRRSTTPRELPPGVTPLAKLQDRSGWTSAVQTFAYSSPVSRGAASRDSAKKPPVRRFARSRLEILQMPQKRRAPQPGWATVEAALRSQGQALQEIKSAVDENRAAVEGLGAAVSENRVAVHDLRRRQEATFETVDAVRLAVEDMRSQNRLTIEAVESTRTALERRIDEVDRESRSRDAVLEMAVREVKVSLQQVSVDVRDLSARVEALARIEARVSALERRLA